MRRQPKEALVALLAELAVTNSEAEARLARHALAADPARLAAEFRTRLQTWKRSRRFRGRSGAAVFGRALEAWLDEIERELLPLDPAKAHALAEAFLRTDEHFFEQADDSDARSAMRSVPAASSGSARRRRYRTGTLPRGSSAYMHS